jgi:histidinol phosphatase-like PHP family hydrolase
MEGLSYFDAGVNIARKGWLEKEQVLNSRDCAGVQGWFNQRK